jgi:hypothetical protein
VEETDLEEGGGFGVGVPCEAWWEAGAGWGGDAVVDGTDFAEEADAEGIVAAEAGGEGVGAVESGGEAGGTVGEGEGVEPVAADVEIGVGVGVGVVECHGIAAAVAEERAEDGGVIGLRGEREPEGGGFEGGGAP